jgi:hypothetical protein
VALLVACRSLAAIDAAAAPEAVAEFAALRQEFASPPRSAGPWAYWFWWNGVLAEKEVAREVAELAEAGFAGAEIRCVTFHGWGGPPLEGMDDEHLARIGHRRLKYLEPEFLGMLVRACQEARRHGLQLALNLGQGWPPGGPWIDDAHRSKVLDWQTWEVDGPREFVLDALPPTAHVLAWRLEPGADGPRVVDGSFAKLADTAADTPAGADFRWNAPEGKWLVALFRQRDGGVCDKGEGPEADPASRAAVEAHLGHLFGALDPHLRPFYGSTLVDFAVDSWEYDPRDAHFWSPVLPAAYRAATGRELLPRLHALAGYGPDAAEVVAELSEVAAEAVHENFFATVAAALHERGLGLRAQAYGRGLPRDYQRAYAQVDTPEVEHNVVLPEAVWGARAAGRRLTSVEGFTFLNRHAAPVRSRRGEWETSPELLRLHANHYFGEGINRIGMHSFSYSPPEIPAPGWRMYAEIDLNRLVPWWSWMPHVNAWIARHQVLLQAGRPVRDALVYPVASDVLEPPYRTAGRRQPVSAANMLDGANAWTLPLIAARAARDKEAGGELLLLADVPTLREAELLRQLLGDAGRMTCCGTLPEDWTGLRGPQGEPLRRSFAEARRAGRVRDARDVSWQQAADALRSVRWEPAAAELRFQHRAAAGADFYFLVNHGDPFDGMVVFPHPGKAAALWDADAGSVVPVAEAAPREGGVAVRLALGHFDSALIAFRDEPAPPTVVRGEGGSYRYEPDGTLAGLFDRSGAYRGELSDGRPFAVRAEAPPPRTVSGPWTLRTEGSASGAALLEQPLRLDRLEPWRRLPGMTRFAGVAVYATEFPLEASLLELGLVWDLGLGEVYEVADVRLNGRPAGPVWAAPWTIDVTPLLVPGANRLEVRVANVLKHQLEQAAEDDRPAGLLGPVRLIPRAREVIARTGAAAPPKAAK